MKPILPLVLATLAGLVCTPRAVAQSPIAKLGASSISVVQSSGEVRIPIHVSADPVDAFFGTSVQWQAVNGTATYGRDYTDNLGWIKFETGDRQKHIVIPIPVTPPIVGTRTFSVSLQNGDRYTLGTPSTVVITIRSKPAKGPKIAAKVRNLPGYKSQVTITATDADGKSTKKKVTVRGRK